MISKINFVRSSIIILANYYNLCIYHTMLQQYITNKNDNDFIVEYYACVTNIAEIISNNTVRVTTQLQRANLSYHSYLPRYTNVIAKQ